MEEVEEEVVVVVTVVVVVVCTDITCSFSLSIQALRYF
jgi:hypothetical protein